MKRVAATGKSSRSKWAQSMQTASSTSAYLMSSPKQGCFVRRRPEVLPRASINWAPEETHTKRRFTITRDIYSRAAYISSGTEAIVKRAWCIQEIVLCRRMLWFQRRGIRWQCAHRTQATQHRPSDRMTQMCPEDHTLPGLLTGSALASSRLADVYSFWDRTLELYSACGLSRPVQDKLRAIEGVARQIEERTGDDCVLGHFWNVLLHSLSWYPYEGDARTSERALPSWSWASRDGPIRLPLRESETHALAQVILPENAGALSTNRLSEANLTFIGKLLRVEFTSDLNFCGSGTEWFNLAHMDNKAETERLRSRRTPLYLFPVPCSLVVEAFHGPLQHASPSSTPRFDLQESWIRRRSGDDVRVGGLPWKNCTGMVLGLPAIEAEARCAQLTW